MSLRARVGRLERKAPRTLDEIELLIANGQVASLTDQELENYIASWPAHVREAFANMSDEELEELAYGARREP